MLPMVQKVFFNKLDREENRQVEDLSSRELTVLTPLLVLMVVLGLFPTPILNRMEPSVERVLERVEEGRATLELAGVVELEQAAGTAAARPADAENSDSNTGAPAGEED